MDAAHRAIEQTTALIRELETATDPSALESRAESLLGPAGRLAERVAAQLRGLVILAASAFAAAATLVVLVIKLVPRRV